MRELHESCALLFELVLFLLLPAIIEPKRGGESAVAEEGGDDPVGVGITGPESGKGADAEAKCRF